MVSQKETCQNLPTTKFQARAFLVLGRVYIDLRMGWYRDDFALKFRNEISGPIKNTSMIREKKSGERTMCYGKLVWWFQPIWKVLVKFPLVGVKIENTWTTS